MDPSQIPVSISNITLAKSSCFNVFIDSIKSECVFKKFKNGKHQIKEDGCYRLFGYPQTRTILGNKFGTRLSHSIQVIADNQAIRTQFNQRAVTILRNLGKCKFFLFII